MDSSHLQPAAAQHPLARDSSSDGHRPSHEAQQSTSGWGPSHTGVMPRFKKARKTLVLCFDGTGNQFHGDSSDSNILKIFRMLDRSSGHGLHYYQPGIGTYVATAQLSARGSYEKLKNWYVKMKDSAVGTSFADHVVGGYKFLMQYYTPGDNIYMFGFSRGSYTARFLAEMIDWVGLITHGNEEMIQFAWRTFSKWKAIDSHSLEAKRKQKKAYEFLVSFRETFSRPVRRIVGPFAIWLGIPYILTTQGLFDTVNSVPRFENAVLSRHRVPFSAISSAKIIRHAVSIDERRAKFRADLVSHGMAAQKDTNKPLEEQMDSNPHPHHDWIHRSARYKHPKPSAPAKPAASKLAPERAERRESRGRQEHDDATRYRSHSRAHSHRSQSSVGSVDERGQKEGGFVLQVGDGSSINLPIDLDDDLSSDGEEDDQDIQEVWFPGGHGDIGGGWDIQPGEMPLSHVPLVWIVHEAQKAGLEFDPEKMEIFDCLDGSEAAATVPLPTIEVSATGSEGKVETKKIELGNKAYFKQILEQTAASAALHDCLRFGGGLSWGGTFRWRLMEYLPFRRLDLGDDGKWKPIRWPLPRGEVRDMPDNALVHISAIKRMEVDPSYRPGNLILGGGGVGKVVAPKEAGIGEWLPAGDQEDFVRARVLRKPKEKKEKEKKKENQEKSNGK